MPFRHSPAPASGPPNGPWSFLQGRRVLIADDHALNRNVVRAILAEAGCIADAASGGREALDMAAASPYDVVLLDCRMPDLDGPSTARAILALPPPHGDARILALTGASIPEEEARCLAAGMLACLVKPLRSADLEAALVRALGQPAPRSAPAAAAWSAAEAPAMAPTLDGTALAQLAALADASNPRFLADLVRGFIADMPATLSVLAASVQARDDGRLALDAHTLKGGAAHLGAMRLAEVCQALEDAGTEGHWELAAAALCEVQEESAKLRAALAPFALPHKPS